MSIASKLTSNVTPIKSDELAWETMDVTSLSKPMQEMFNQLMRAQEAERTSRKALSDAIGAVLELPPHLTVRIGCKWGRLSVAIDKAQRSTSAKPAMSLSDLVAKANRIA
jgi:hypothetical protein